MFEGTSDEQFEMQLVTTLKGMSDVDKATETNRKFAASQTKVADALKSAVGPYERLSRVTAELNKAQGADTSADRLRDLQVMRDNALRGVQRIESRAGAANAPYGPEPAKIRDMYGKPIGPNPMKYAAGPNSRLNSLREQLNHAMTSGADEDTVSDLAHLTRKAYARANPQDKPTKPDPSTWDRMKGVLMSSRFGGGANGMGGMLPLVGQTLKAGLGPYMLLGEAAQASAKALDEMSDRARQSAQKFQEAMLLSAGNSRSAAEASTLETVGGMEPNAAGRLKSAVGSHDMMSNYWAQRLGLNMMPDLPGAPVDRNAELSKAVQKLRDLKAAGKLNQGEEYQALQSLGIPDGRMAVDLTDKEWATQQRITALNQGQNGRNARRQADDARFNENAAKESQDQDNRGGGNFWTGMKNWAWQMSTGFNLDQTEKGMRMAHDFLKKTNGGDTASPGMVKGGMGLAIPDIRSLLVPDNASPNPSSRFPSNGAAMTKGNFNIGGGGDDALTTAIWHLVSTLQSGVYGGGDRARSALPDRVQGQWLVRAVEEKALKLAIL